SRGQPAGVKVRTPPSKGYPYVSNFGCFTVGLSVAYAGHAMREPSNLARSPRNTRFLSGAYARPDKVAPYARAEKAAPYADGGATGRGSVKPPPSATARSGLDRLGDANGRAAPALSPAEAPRHPSGPVLPVHSDLDPVEELRSVPAF